MVPDGAVEVFFDDLPKEAQDLISEDQKTFLDEFHFWKDSFGYIEAEYAGELLATWDGHGWKE
jgi:hypothetical protein